MPTRSRDKLNEASYFLARMKESPRDQRVPFVYYLSAMVSAARSVTYVIQDEFAHVPGFPDWYLGVRQKMKQDDLMTFMNAIRVENVHKAAVRPKARITIPVSAGSVSVEMELEVPGSQPGVRQIVGLERTVTAPPGTNVDWILSRVPIVGEDEGGIDREAISASEEWIAKLEAIVDECENRFLRPSPGR